MNIKVNGTELTLEREITIKELLNLQQVEMQDDVTVQINEELIYQEEFNTTTLKENDSVEYYISWVVVVLNAPLSKRFAKQ